MARSIIFRQTCQRKHSQPHEQQRHLQPPPMNASDESLGPFPTGHFRDTYTPSIWPFMRQPNSPLQFPLPREQTKPQLIFRAKTGNSNGRRCIKSYTTLRLHASACHLALWSDRGVLLLLLCGGLYLPIAESHYREEGKEREQRWVDSSRIAYWGA